MLSATPVQNKTDDLMSLLQIAGKLNGRTNKKEIKHFVINFYYGEQRRVNITHRNLLFKIKSVDLYLMMKSNFIVN